MFKIILSLLILLPVLAGCSGVQTFPNMARAGDTVSVGMGWQKRFKRSNTTVTITPSTGVPIVYQPNDPAVRAIINLYPDPVSWLVVGTDTKTDALYNYAYTYGSIINNNFTGGDHDWWQTAAFIDLPTNLPLGTTNIALTNDVGDSASSLVEVIAGVGTPNDFNALGNGSLSTSQLASMERAPYFEVSFNGTVIPYAIELKFSHTGVVHVVNPRSSITNIIWTDDGITLKVMLLPAQSQKITNFHDFKFYIAGTGTLQLIQDIQPLVLQSTQFYDLNGNVVTGVNVSINANIN